MKRNEYRYMLRGNVFRIYRDGAPVYEEPILYDRRAAAERVRELNQMHNDKQITSKRWKQ